MLVDTATPADRTAIISLWHTCGLTRPWNDPATDYDLARSFYASMGYELQEVVVIGKRF
jgi:hypothetical protein